MHFSTQNLVTVIKINRIHEKWIIYIYIYIYVCMYPLNNKI